MYFPLVGGQFAAIDDVDADLAEVSWCLMGGKNGQYVARGKTVYLHRVIAERMGLVLTGETQGRAWKRSVDHIDGNKLNNRRSNLRLRTRSQQMSNLADGLRADNKSGIRGVCRTGSRRSPWHAFGRGPGSKILDLGYFATTEEAAAARHQWEATLS
jgi:hypothetical protein